MAIRTFIISLFLMTVSSSASAKDDTPDPIQLGIDHPWRPSVPSVTKVALKCGPRSSAAELRIDERGWVQLVGPKTTALVTPFGRFLRTDSKWRAADEKAWRTVSIGGSKLDLWIGDRTIPKNWTVRSAKRVGASIEVRLWDGRRVRLRHFDPIDRIWTTDKNGEVGIEVTLRTRFADRMLPTKLELTNGCTMTRTSRLAKPKLPNRKDLGL